MNLQETYIFFEGLKNQTTNKYEIRVYEKFIHILGKLKIREFSKDEIKSVETELDRLSLKSSLENKKKFYKKALNNFEKYLRDTFALIPEGYYTQLGIVLGMSFGTVAGILIGERFEKSLGVSLGMVIGIAIGGFVGRSMDAKAKSEKRTL